MVKIVSMKGGKTSDRLFSARLATLLKLSFLHVARTYRKQPTNINPDIEKLQKEGIADEKRRTPADRPVSASPSGCPVPAECQTSTTTTSKDLGK